MSPELSSRPVGDNSARSVAGSWSSSLAVACRSDTVPSPQIFTGPVFTTRKVGAGATTETVAEFGASVSRANSTVNGDGGRLSIVSYRS